MSSSRIIRPSKGEIIKMTSALGDSTKDRRLNWPSTALFNTISNNIDGEGLAPSVKRSIELGLEHENHICCSCDSDCSTNANCECLKMARLMNETFGGDLIVHGQPIDNPASDEKKMYWDQPRFVCGPRCSCRKDCLLNAIQNIDMNQTKKFEILRTDGKGFCLYANFNADKGTPIASFNGELVGPGEVKKDMDIHQYSLQVIANDDPFWKVLSKCKSMDKEYKEQLKKAYRSTVFVNPLKKGNFTRMTSHSCDPNMEILRVFQGGISPADLRVIFVATKAIEAGDELTFNYGDDYVEEHLGTCLCNKCKEERRRSNKRKIEDTTRVLRSQAKKQCT
ncbi:unnamed protein product [Caenorhabditis brenneri]